MDSAKLLTAAQRFFATETNNTAWDLIGRTSRTTAETEQMIATAYASLMHWTAVGAPANVARANGTVGRALVVRGDAAAKLALEHAKKYLAWATGDEGAPWDQVFAHATVARAQAALGEMGDARDARRWADEALAKVSEAEDRKICEDDLALGPWFGLDQL